MQEQTHFTQDNDQLARIIMLVYGPMQNGNGSYWCYVAIKPSQYQRFMSLYKARTLNLYDFEKDGFGEIVVSGQGVRPPMEVTYQVAQIYKINIKDLFGDIDAESVLSKKIQQLKEKKDTIH